MVTLMGNLFPIILLLSVTGTHSQLNASSDKEPDCDCGISPVLLTFVINGDEVTDMKMYPWLVSFHDISDPDEKPWGNCAGSLISDNTVVTASHCLVTTNCPDGEALCVTPLSTFRVGLMGASHEAPERLIKASEIIQHPNFVIATLTNDIAVVKLAERVPCTDYTRPICISDEDFIRTRSIKKLKIAGWGRMESLVSSEVLRDGLVELTDAQQCSDDYGTNPRETICAFSKGQYACHGDSGSPAVVRNGDQFFIVGVTSGGRMFCPLGYPMFYTSTSHYYSFIMQAMNSY